MPRTENKRITVREATLVVEDKDFRPGAPGTDAGAPTPSLQEKKAVIIPTGFVRKAPLRVRGGEKKPKKSTKPSLDSNSLEPENED